MSSFVNVPEIFGTNVFNEATMKERLTPEVYNAWKQCIVTGSSLQLDVANAIAFLLSAEFITGHVLNVDGGFVI